MCDLFGTKRAASARGSPQGGPIPWNFANERLADTARSAIRTEGKVGIRFFDTYRIASTQLVNTLFNVEARTGVTEVSILGFGKFGRDLMEILIRDLGPDEQVMFHVYDKEDRRTEVLDLAEELGMDGKVTFTQSTIQDIRLVDREDNAIFLCTDDDLRNLTVAMKLAARVCCTHIYVRMRLWPLSAVSEHFGADRGVHFRTGHDQRSEATQGAPA